MSTVLTTEPPVEVPLQPLELDQDRGRQGMWLFIGSETFLFLVLFVSYFFLAYGDWRWLREPAPKLVYACVNVGVLVVSSAVLRWGGRNVESGRFAMGRLAVGIALFCGFVYLGLSALDYRDHLIEVTPQANAYGSIFYTIESFHVAHLIVGMLMLGYVLILPKIGRTDRPPHRAYHDVALYWHFVTITWIVTTFLIYGLPNMR